MEKIKRDKKRQYMYWPHAYIEESMTYLPSSFIFPLTPSCFSSQFTVPKHEVAKRIAQRETGCMLMVLSMVLQNKIVVHQELDQSEITFGTVIGVV
jgi:hypothetical protein